MNWSIKADQVAHDERIVRGPIQRDVPRHGDDARNVGEGCGRDDRHSVVVARIAVEEQARAVVIRHAREHGRPSCTLGKCNDVE